MFLPLWKQRPTGVAVAAGIHGDLALAQRSFTRGRSLERFKTDHPSPHAFLLLVRWGARREGNNNTTYVTCDISRPVTVDRHHRLNTHAARTPVARWEKRTQYGADCDVYIVIRWAVISNHKVCRFCRARLLWSLLLCVWVCAREFVPGLPSYFFFFLVTELLARKIFPSSRYCC